MVAVKLVRDSDCAGGVAREVSVGLIDVVATWSEALHGGGCLASVFSDLVRALGAEVGLIVRSLPGGVFPQVIAASDDSVTDSRTALRTSLAVNLFGSYLSSAQPATVWLASEHADETDATASARLAAWQAARGLREMAVLVLTNCTSARDHIELHFAQPVDAIVLRQIAAVLPTLARAWARRSAGLVSAQLVDRRRVAADRQSLPTGTPLLSVANPAQLSRAEFRICVLLSRGLSVKGLLGELGLSEATVRSHLRSIYAKTGAGSLADLVFRLMDGREDPNPALLRRA